MMTTADRRHAGLKLAALFLVAPFVLGCETQAQIQTYTVKKERVAAPAAPAATAKPGEATDRMLGAILPAGDRTWYFKVTGPVAAMDKRADEITKYFESIRIPAGAAKPEWKVPKGWKEQAGSGMRAATLMVPADDKPMELSVIALPTTGVPGELLSNVNRWRGQLKLPQVDDKGLAESVKETKAGDAKIYIVDLRGEAAPNNMTAPFAGGGPFSGGAPRGPVTAEAAGGANLPAGHPPVNPHGGGDSPLSFKAPKSWPASTPDGMRKAMFAFKDGAREGRVTAIDIPANSGPKIGDPLENINRWRGDVGLAEIKKEDLAKNSEPIEIDGKHGHYAEMIPDVEKAPDGQPARATIAAMVPAGEVIWFFKLTGDRDIVTRERENFKAFLDSVRFSPADGDSDGN